MAWLYAILESMILNGNNKKVDECRFLAEQVKAAFVETELVMSLEMQSGVIKALTLFLEWKEALRGHKEVMCW